MIRGARRALIPVLGALLLVAAAVACDPPFEPLIGSLTVSVATSGVDRDPDGYGVRVDGGPPQAVAPNGTLTIPGLPIGQHSVTIDGVAVNCAVSGSAARVVTVTTGTPAALSYQILCSALVGNLVVQTATTGPQPDPDGYFVTVDGGPSRTVTGNGQIVITNLPIGDHFVTLSGVAANCTVGATNPRPVTVPYASTAYASFAVACIATTGQVEVSVATSGADLDPDGYDLIVDGGAPRFLAVNGATTVSGLNPGDHTVLLSGIAGNCAVRLANPVTVTVVVGQTVSVPFDVSCVLAYGAIRVTTSTSGADADPDGYGIRVDSGPTHVTGINATMTIGNVLPGDRVVQLEGVAPNCTAGPAAADTVTVVIGDTVDAAFAVSCVSTTGTVRVIVATGGASLDPDGYTVLMDYVCDYYYGCYYAWAEAVAVNDTVTLAGVTVGNQDVLLDGMTRNCTVAGSNPRTAAVPPGDTVRLAFDVTCAPAGNLEVATATSGVDQDGGYLVQVDGVPWQWVTANGLVTIAAIGEGDHTITLGDVAANCTVQGGNQQTVHVTAGTTVRVTFIVSCISSLGTLAVTVVTTGTDLDPDGYTVLVDYYCDYYYGCYYGWTEPVAANDTLTLTMPMGGHTVWLDGVAPNCTIAGPSGLAVTVPAADTGRVTFQVSCVHVEVLVAYGAAGYRFKVLPDSTQSGGGFEVPGFDDVAGGFSDGTAAFGNLGGCALDATVRTNWPQGTDLLLRQSFVPPGGPGTIKVRVAIDNDIQVFVNGVDITASAGTGSLVDGFQRHGGCAQHDDFVFVVPNAILLSGTNLLAVRARDEGGVSYVDLQVSVEP